MQVTIDGALHGTCDLRLRSCGLSWRHVRSDGKVVALRQRKEQTAGSRQKPMVEKTNGSAEAPGRHRFEADIEGFELDGGVASLRR